MDIKPAYYGKPLDIIVLAEKYYVNFQAGYRLRGDYEKLCKYGGEFIADREIDTSEITPYQFFKRIEGLGSPQIGIDPMHTYNQTAVLLFAINFGFKIEDTQLKNVPKELEEIVNAVRANSEPTEIRLRRVA